MYYHPRYIRRFVTRIFIDDYVEEDTGVESVLLHKESLAKKLVPLLIKEDRLVTTTMSRDNLVGGVWFDTHLNMITDESALLFTLLLQRTLPSELGKLQEEVALRLSEKTLSEDIGF